MKMTSDKMTVYFTDKNEIKTIVAVGNVVITQDTKKAMSERASYNATQEVLILTGAPAVISSGASTSQGKKITYWIKENRTVIEGATVKIKSGDAGGVNILGGRN
jgi:lipopolysaccharide export system protein LptA